MASSPKRNGNGNEKANGPRKAHGWSPEQYRRYISSKRWKKRKKRFRESLDSETCLICRHGADIRGTVALQVHHQSYKRLGSELDEDLALLCQECHSQLHKIYDSYKTNSLYISELSDAQNEDVGLGSCRLRAKKAQPKAKKAQPKAKKAQPKAKKARAIATGARYQDRPTFNHGEALRRRKADYDRSRTDKGDSSGYQAPIVFRPEEQDSSPEDS